MTEDTIILDIEPTIALRKGKQNFALILTNVDTGSVVDVLLIFQQFSGTAPMF